MQAAETAEMAKLMDMKKVDIAAYVASRALDVQIPGNYDMFPSQKEKTMANIKAAIENNMTPNDQLDKKLFNASINDKTSGLSITQKLI